MSLSAALSQRVRARRDEDEDEDEETGSYSSEDDGNASDPPEASSISGSDPPGENDESDEDGNASDNSTSSSNASLKAPEADASSDLKSISFGALAKAQASLPPAAKKRKTHHDHRESRGEEEEEEEEGRGGGRTSDPSTNNDRATKSTKTKSKKDLPSRSSKHAPQSLPSNRPTSRRRVVVSPPPVPKARDPRFDSLTPTAAGSKHANAAAASAQQNYAFLESYRESEISELRSQIRKTKNPNEKAALERTLRSTLDKQRAFTQKKKMAEVAARHRKSERELLREGKKSQPYFLKKGDVRKEVLKEKWEGMKGNERKKVMERRRKKVAGRERKEMPDTRRAAAGGRQD